MVVSMVYSNVFNLNNVPNVSVLGPSKLNVAYINVEKDFDTRQEFTLHDNTLK